MQELFDLELDEFSLVDVGANPCADILIYKREKGDQKVAEKIVTPEKKGDQEVAEKIVTPEKNPAPEKIELDKNFAQVNETIKQLQTKLDEHIEKVQAAEFKKIASKYEILGEDAENLAKQLKAAQAVGKETYDTLINVLDRSLEIVKKSGLFEEIGKTGENTLGEPEVQIEKIAKEYQKNDPTLTYRAALDKAFVDHPELRY